MAITTQSVFTALGAVIEPELARPITEAGLIRDVTVTGDDVALTIDLTTPACPHKGAIEDAVRVALRGLGAREIAIRFSHHVPAREIPADDPCPGVKNIVLVMSGKGGVGKSTVAANLAVALTKRGCSVGLLDADMYGPSVPTMFGVAGRPGSADGQKFLPLERLGVKLMSIGFLLDSAQTAVVWRGPMLQNALLQFLGDVEWGELDYLVLDLPPGTGDVALTIAQKVRSSGAIIVTTPQEVALQDVYKSVSMALKLGIPVLGVVENQSVFICDGCGKEHAIFGSGGGAKVSAQAGAPLLAQIPVERAIREWGDTGTPVVAAAPDSAGAKAFMELAGKLAGRISVQNLERGGGLRIDRSGGAQRRLNVVR